MSAIKRKASADSQSEHNFFPFGATLRIVGKGLDFDEINKRLGVSPTYAHRKGEPDPSEEAGPVYPTDMWCYTVQLDGLWPLDEHIKALWEVLRPHADFLRNLKRHFSLDIFCVYICRRDDVGSVYVGYETLQMFTELQIPFGIHINREDAV